MSYPTNNYLTICRDLAATRNAYHIALQELDAAYDTTCAIRDTTCAAYDAACAAYDATYAAYDAAYIDQELRKEKEETKQ